MHLAIAAVVVVSALIVGKQRRGMVHHLPDFKAIPDTTERKQAFFEYLVPHINAINDQIRDERSHLQSIRDDFVADGEVGWLARRWLAKIAPDYALDLPDDIGLAFLDRLSRRVDVVAPSLILAQAANESAWGTSRFAKLGNNLFGMRTYEPGTGIVPRQRERGATWEVAAYDSVRESIAAYVQNLNTHDSYHRLRLVRRDLRRQQRPITGVALAGGLVSYSEKGHEYVALIRSLIRANHLDRYDE